MLLVLCLVWVVWVGLEGMAAARTLFAHRHSLLGLQVRDQAQMAQDASAAQFAAAQLAARLEGDSVEVGSGGLLNGVSIANETTLRSGPLNAPSAPCLGSALRSALLPRALACRR